MKMPGFRLLGRGCVVCLLAVLVHLPMAILASPAVPVISSIGFDRAEVVVSVQVPPGVKKVTLESRSRLGAGSWVPRAVARLEGDEATLTFRLPKSAEAEILRVRTDAEEALPSAFYAGTNTFQGGAIAGTGDRGPAPPGEVGGPAPGDGANDPGSPREVVESDIWKFSGSTLYFFNQYRGLQVIDLSAPDLPVITGTFPLPAAGEQMYVLDSGFVILLARTLCGWTESGESSQAIVLDVSGAAPRQVGNVVLPGFVQESRMVGTALYVASQAYRPIAGSRETAWEWGSVISSFDLSDPAKPVAQDSFFYSGSGHVIHATDQYLFVATQSPNNWSQSILRCIDISSPAGQMKALASITTAGRVPDKFKIHQVEDVLTVISEDWNSPGRVGVVTVLETFSLANPSMPERLGQLLLAQGEQLHASRFDGDRVYIVTFFRVDPLWIVDLSDPRAPRVTGELHVPGWSTYIEPLGDRLVAIGINDSNDWRVAVSLFDVRDPARPSLLSKVPLGIDQSWSEATQDEKAFRVLPAAGLILVPYQGFESNGFASRVQLIDLAPDSLKARGTIEHGFQPRRATLHDSRIYSISGKELLVVDAADRDRPALRAEVELSWSVDRVFILGDYLIEVADGVSWGGWWSQGAATPPSVRVAKASDPERTLAALVLPDAQPVIGATVQDGTLYLAQGSSNDFWPMAIDAADGGAVENAQTPPALVLAVIDLGQLPEPRLVGRTTASTEFLGWNASLEPVWPTPGVLVWSGGGWGPAFWRDGVDAVAPPDSAIGRPWWGGTGGRLIAFDVSSASEPVFVSEVNLAANQWWSFSQAYSADGLVYISHQASEFLEGVTLPGQTAPGAGIADPDKDPGAPAPEDPTGVWVQRHYLDVIDYGDPKQPTVRPAVNIPGRLQGLSHNGSLLYTLGPHWTNWMTDWAEWLDASAYDGVSASLVDSLPLPKEWPHPVLIHGGQVWLGRPDSIAAHSALEAWVLSNSGNFTRTSSIQLGSIANTFHVSGSVLVVQENNSELTLFDARDPASLEWAGKGRPAGCLWYDLSRAVASPAGLWLPLGDYGVVHIPISR